MVFSFFLPKVYSQVPAVHLPGCTAWKRTHWAKLIKLMKLLGAFPYSLVFQIPNVRIGAILISPPKKEVRQYFFYPQNSLSLGRKKKPTFGPGTVEMFTYLEVVPFLFLMHELELIRCEVFRVETDHGNWDGFGHPEYSYRDFVFFVKTVITMDFLVDFFGTGKYADTSPMNCVSGVLTRAFSMCFPGFDLFGDMERNDKNCLVWKLLLKFWRFHHFGDWKSGN